MKIRVYLDTSVFSAYYDDRVPVRKRQTEELWERFPEFAVSTSEVTLKEIEETKDSVRREKLRNLLRGITLLPLNHQMIELADRYIEREIFFVESIEDAQHVAVAVLTNQDLLLSWNYRHLVNRRKRSQINSFNASLGLPQIEIIAPPEI